MGILNVTSDSFSGDGVYAGCRLQAAGYNRSQIGRIVAYAQRMVEDGADIIDVGGESTRPGARPVPLKEEMRRVIPVIKALAEKIKAPLSVDTYKPQVAEAALDNGAAMVNDISGLGDARMACVVKRYKARIVIMHIQGQPKTMQRRPRYKDVVVEVRRYFRERIRRARDAGIARAKIIIDPGIGFGKTLRHNLEILRRLRELKSLGFPLLVGVSRKSFIGALTGKEAPQERIFGTAAAVSLAADRGADILRVHDVAAMADALKVVNAVIN